MSGEQLITSINADSNPSSKEKEAETSDETVLRLTPRSVFLPSALSFEYVEVSWEFVTKTSLIDWLGLYPIDELNPLLFLDFRSYGECGQRTGKIKWKITTNCMPASTQQAKVCFRYYSGLTGAVRATSPPLLVYSDAQVVITGIKCRNIKSAKGSYSAKVSYGTAVVYKTPHSSTAEWEDLRFSFPADRSQELLLTIKEHSGSGSRPIGEVNISTAEIIHRKVGELAFTLRSNNNAQFNTQVVIQCHFTPTDANANQVKMTHSVRPPSVRLATCEDDFNNNNNNEDLAGIASSSSASSTSYSTGMSSSFMSQRSTNGNSSTESITNLPKGWEVRVDKYGHLIYVDHVHRRTTWNPPVILEREYAEEAENRYGHARRTVFVSNSPDGDLGTQLTNNNVNESQISSGSSKSTNAALTFLRRDDFVRVLHQNETALKMYTDSRYLKQIVHRLRKDIAQFEDFENNREMVNFLNAFADTTQPLPTGWEIAKERGTTLQKFFIDHNRKKITLIDPRLPIETRRGRSEPPPAHGTDMNRNLISDIRHRCEEIERLIRERFPEAAPEICEKIQKVCAFGHVALRQYADDADFVRAISIIDEASTSARSAFEENVHYFYSSLRRAGYAQGPSRVRFTLRRSHLMNDAFEKILAVDAGILRKSKMIISFDEEEGLDYGGPSRELFFLLSRDLFNNPYYGLFEYSANNYKMQISPMSQFADNHLQWFELCGRVLGLAIIHRCQIDSFFTTAFYKMLLGISYTTEDVESIDSHFHSSLMWIRNNPITADLDLTFSATMEVAGEIVETELIPGGKSVLVNEMNKEEFVSLLTKWRVERNVGEQMKALLRGLYSIIDRDCLRIFDATQLELLLSGKVEIDLEDWRTNTEYKGGYYDTHVVINWFWNCVYEMTNAERLKLLQFITGTTAVPHDGFRALRGSDGPKKFTIEKFGTPDSLPRAHTCFNRLDLPHYPTFQTLKNKLKYALEESHTYSIE